MSRVGKKPILIPESVEVKIDNGNVNVKGPKGELFREIRPEISVEVKDKQILVSPRLGATPSAETQKEKNLSGERAGLARDKRTKAFWGLTRALVANMIKGVTEGYEKKLEIEGIGYRASIEGEDLVLSVGFSNPVKIKAPEGVKFLVEKNLITVSGADNEKVSQTAAKIRKIKPPEPYKGKGIRYLGEIVRRKAGKKVVTAG